MTAFCVLIGKIWQKGKTDQGRERGELLQEQCI